MVLKVMQDSENLQYPIRIQCMEPRYNLVGNYES